jgi:hypothetical protein
VLRQASDADPLPVGETADPGTSTQFARADHVHVGGTGGGAEVQDALTPASATKAPSVDAVVLGLADKANSSDVNQTLDNFSASLNAQLATKENALTFVGATRAGDVVSVDASKVAGSLIDGRSWYALCGQTGFSSAGPVVVNSGSSAYANIGATSATNSWNSRGRARLTAAAATGNHARLYTIPQMRFAANSSTLTGFKWVCTYASADALNETTGTSGAMGFVGFTQHANLPAIGVAPSAYTGTRFGFAYNPGDTNWKVYSDGTLIKDLGASFPCHGNETNPYQFEIESVGVASGNRKTTWRITHLLTGATDSGTLDGTGPTSSTELNATIVRDSNGASTQAVFTTTGMAAGAFYNLVVGERLDIPTPVRITATGNLNRLQHANVDLFVESATPVVLTIASSGFVDGDKIFGQNDGAGALTFAGAGGFTIERHADIPAAVEQWQGFTLSYNATANRWVRVA